MFILSEKHIHKENRNILWLILVIQIFGLQNLSEYMFNTVFWPKSLNFPFEKIPEILMYFFYFIQMQK